MIFLNREKNSKSPCTFTNKLFVILLTTLFLFTGCKTQKRSDLQKKDFITQEGAQKPLQVGLQPIVSSPPITAVTYKGPLKSTYKPKVKATAYQHPIILNVSKTLNLKENKITVSATIDFLKQGQKQTEQIEFSGNFQKGHPAWRASLRTDHTVGSWLRSQAICIDMETCHVGWIDFFIKYRGKLIPLGQFNMTPEAPTEEVEGAPIVEDEEYNQYTEAPPTTENQNHPPVITLPEYPAFPFVPGDSEATPEIPDEISIQNPPAVLPPLPEAHETPNAPEETPEAVEPTPQTQSEPEAPEAEVPTPEPQPEAEAQVTDPIQPVPVTTPTNPDEEFLSLQIHFPLTQGNIAFGGYNNGGIANSESPEEILNESGYTCLNITDSSIAKGLNYASGVLKRFFIEVTRNFCTQFPQYSRTQFFVNHIAKNGGGKLNAHRSHQNGLDLDLAYLWKSERKEFKKAYSPSNKAFIEDFDIERNWDFFKLLASQKKYEVTRVFVYDDIKKKFCQRAKQKMESTGALTPLEKKTLSMLSPTPMVTVTVKDQNGEPVYENGQVKTKPIYQHIDHMHIRLQCPKEYMDRSQGGIADLDTGGCTYDYSAKSFYKTTGCEKVGVRF